jgi:uncharacterized repeat protein (TIGR02543 family)
MKIHEKALYIDKARPDQMYITRHMKEDVMGKNKRKEPFCKLFGLRKRKLISLVLVFLLLFNVSGLGVQASEGDDYPSLEVEEAAVVPELPPHENTVVEEGGNQVVAPDDANNNEDEQVANEDADVNDNDISYQDELTADDEKVEEEVDVDEEVIIHQVIFIVDEIEKEPIKVEDGEKIPSGEVPEVNEIIDGTINEETIAWVNTENERVFDLGKPLVFAESRELRLVATFELTETIADEEGFFIRLYNGQTRHRIEVPGEPGVPFVLGPFSPGQVVNLPEVILDQGNNETNFGWTTIAQSGNLPSSGHFLEWLVETGSLFFPNGNFIMPVPPEGENHIILFTLRTEGETVTVTFSHTEGGIFLEGDSPIIYESIPLGLSWDRANIAVPTPEANRGFNFAGWRLLPAVEPSLPLVPPATIVENLHFEAVFRERDDFTVHYDANGGLPPDIDSLEDVRWLQDNLITDEVVTKVGHTLEGWNTARDGSGRWATDVSTYAYLANNIDDPPYVTLYAQWMERTGFTVYYDTNGGVPATIPPLTDVSWTRTGLLPAEPTREGFTFAGWNVTAGGSGINVSATASYGDLAESDTTMSITLTAQWVAVIPPPEPATKIVRYNANHAGTGGAELYFIHPYMLTDGYVVGDDYTVKAYTHGTKVASDGWVLPENYARLRFTGWNTQPDGSGTRYGAGDLIRLDEEAAVPSEVAGVSFGVLAEATAAEPVIISLYAQWELVEEARPPRRPVTKAPQTGDTMAQSILLYLALASLSLIIMAAWFGFNRAKRGVQETCKLDLHQKEFFTNNVMSRLSGRLYALSSSHKRWRGISARKPSEKP